MNKVFINQTIYNLIAADAVVIIFILFKVIFEHSVDMDYVFAMASIKLAIVLFEIILHRR